MYFGNDVLYEQRGGFIGNWIKRYRTYHFSKGTLDGEIYIVVFSEVKGRKVFDIVGKPWYKFEK